MVVSHRQISQSQGPGSSQPLHHCWLQAQGWLSFHIHTQYRGCGCHLDYMYPPRTADLDCQYNLLQRNIRQRETACSKPHQVHTSPPSTHELLLLHWIVSDHLMMASAFNGSNCRDLHIERTSSTAAHVMHSHVYPSTHSLSTWMKLFCRVSITQTTHQSQAW